MARFCAKSSTNRWGDTHAVSQAVKTDAFVYCWCLLYVVITCALAAPASARPSDLTTSSDEAFLNFATPDVWPWGYLADSGSPTGTLVEFSSRVAAVANLPLLNELRPHRRAVLELTSGEADFVVLFESPAAKAAGVEVESVLSVRTLMAGRFGESYPLTINGLAGKTVGYIRGTFYEEAFQDDEHIRKIPVNGLAQAVTMLQLGRIDALVSSDQAFYHTLRDMELPIAGFRTDVVIAEQKACLYMSRKAKHPELYYPVQKAVREMRHTGELDEIFRLPQ
ncbi:substrate-binding periplasmic protein [Marinobacter salicampi]|uniref:substrate-binding periplasmic protein n=1 Tax=Marinobacter salicampi TaxID=435907 RepID=UPI001407704E|nr:transporter substrate-binding domain-containing protein [Marinobacter salicampi]